jgi:very-short-patch-repair endonuclease
MSARDVDRAIEALARRQHGVFSRRQALLAGATSSLVDRRQRSGAWLRLGSGVYALPGNPPTWRRQLKAAELSVEGAAVCGRPAGALHKLTGFRPSRPEIVAPTSASARNDLTVVRRYRPGRLTIVDGIRVVSPAQALVDAASRMSVRGIARALDDLVGDDPADLDLVRTRYLAARGRRGLDGLRALLDERGDGYTPTESELEEALREVVGAATVLPVTWQTPLPWWPRSSQRVDGLIEPWRVVLEADGRRWHTRVADFERDHDRDLTALRHGYVVARFTWLQLTRRPGECVAVLSDIGHARSVGTVPPPAADTALRDQPRAFRVGDRR